MYFSTKNYLKSIHNHIAKHAFNVEVQLIFSQKDKIEIDSILFSTG
jgi:hypothetical protein